MADTAVQTGTIQTKIPARLDRLPWSGFHWRILIGLGTVWILDGLEVTMVGNVAARMTDDGSGIAFSASDAGLAGTIYIIGACAGALIFGHITDRLGRRKLFMITLAIYMIGAFASAFAWVPWFFFLTRFFTGSGIGGEYAAINSAIDELIPARVRGQIDLVINGTYWAGAAGGAALALVFLNENWFATWLGWRLGFGVGIVLALLILLVRRHIPESPRWLFIHGREQEAERIVDNIEHDVIDDTGQQLSQVDKTITVRQRRTISFRTIAKTAFKLYPGRAILGIVLFIGQAFMYNGITFDLGTLFTGFYPVASSFVPILFMVFAGGNFLGPVLLGRLFDTVGRKPMISGTYIASAVMSIPVALVFVTGAGGMWTLMGLIVVTFFLASAGASAAYLTVSEIFPMETRAMAIGFFYAVGTAAGGISGPLLFGYFIESGVRGLVMTAFFIGAAVMAIAGVCEIFLGIKAEQVDLESIATPLSVEEANGEQSGQSGQSDSRTRGHIVVDADQEPDGAGSARGPSGTSVGGADQEAVAEAQRYASEAREAAEQARSRSAEHRADAHDAASSGEEDAASRREVGESLADIEELRAQEHDQQAMAGDERAAPETPGATLRARAADERASARAEQIEAQSSDSDTEADQHHARAEAAEARARSREQLAAAEVAEATVAGGASEVDSSASSPSPDGGDSDESAAGQSEWVARAKAAAHRAWSELDEQRAAMYDARAAGDTDEAERREEQAHAAEQQAQAAQERIETAEHAAEAEEVRAERESTEQQSEQQAAAERQRQDEARVRDERIRQRVERQKAGQRGLRRWRPGPGMSMGRTWSGGPASPRAGQEALDEEIETIARALTENGATRRSDLARRIGARYWGPGRFGAALDAAVSEGRAKRVSRGTFGPPDAGDGE